MAPYPPFDVEDLADFTGEPAAMFPSYAEEAIAQAIFLVKIRTKIKEWPADPDLAQLMRYAILNLADTLRIERENAVIKASPLSSQSMGNYSWSKSNAYSVSRYKAWPTGIEWLDILLDYLAEDEDSRDPIHASGGVHVFEYDGVWRSLENDDDLYLPGPEALPDGPTYNRHGFGT